MTYQEALTYVEEHPQYRMLTIVDELQEYKETDFWVECQPYTPSGEIDSVKIAKVYCYQYDKLVDANVNMLMPVVLVKDEDYVYIHIDKQSIEYNATDKALLNMSLSLVVHMFNEVVPKGKQKEVAYAFANQLFQELKV